MTRFTAPAPTVALAGRSLALFTTLGVVGYVVGGLVGVALSVVTGRSVAAIVGLHAVSAVVFFSVALSGKVLTGRERLVYYHQEIAILTACAAVSSAAGWPVLAELDLVAVGVGVFLVFGRLGCAAAGCCHGRPARSGIVYGPAHVRLGLAPALAGRPLLPVPLLEAAGVAVLTTACAVLVVRGAAPGAALVVSLAGYGIGRWLLECLRGDPRASWLGSSHTQWTALGLSAVVAALQATAVLPNEPPHVVVAAVLGAAITWRARRQRMRRPPPGRTDPCAHGPSATTLSAATRWGRSGSAS